VRLSRTTSWTSMVRAVPDSFYLGEIAVVDGANKTILVVELGLDDLKRSLATQNEQVAYWEGFLG